MSALLKVTHSCSGIWPKQPSRQPNRGKCSAGVAFTGYSTVIKIRANQ